MSTEKNVLQRISAKYTEITKTTYGAHTGFARVLSLLLMWVLSCYIVFTQYTATSSLFEGSRETITAILTTVLLTLLTYQGLKCIFYVLRRAHLNVFDKQKKRSPLLFVCSFLVVFAFLLLFFVANYPGGVSLDNIDQWNQAVSMNISNWHPAIHTLLMAPLLRIHQSYPFVICMQTLAFSLGIAYMVTVLSSWGFRWYWLAIVFACIVSNRNTIAILQYAYKDTAFSIALVFLATHCISIVLSDGEWLRSRRHVAALSIAVALVTLFRHNGLLFTMPLLLLMLLIFPPLRKRVAAAGALALALVFLIRVPLYNALDVTQHPEQTYIESVGLPMTILADVKTQNPQALDAETTAFLGKIASDEDWERLHGLHAYNPIKWNTNANAVIMFTKPSDLLRMTFTTIKSDPRDAFEAFVGLTDMVWRTDIVEEAMWVWTADGQEEKVAEMAAQDVASGFLPLERIGEAKETAQRITGGLDAILNSPFPFWLATCLGIYLLALMICGMFSILYRQGIKALLFVLPSMVYNIATMLLLAGNDYRLFHFNLVITLPYALACFAKQAPRAEKPGVATPEPTAD